MIPAGYAASIHAWATRPDLTDQVRAARRTLLLSEHDALVSGQLGGKAVASLRTAGANGKSFEWQIELSASEKLTVITDVLDRMGLLSSEARPTTMTYGAFANLQR
jgi:hypothetical protein